MIVPRPARTSHFARVFTASDGACETACCLHLVAPVKTSLLSLLLLATLSGCGGLVVPTDPYEPPNPPGEPPIPEPPSGPIGQGQGGQGQGALGGKPRTQGFEVGSFTAEYYNGTQLVASEKVERPAINYPWSDFHGIRSEDFRGVWTGTIDVAQSGLIAINADYSWADGKLFIDDVQVPFGRTHTPTLAVGSHAVRVELDNNWHTTGFNMSFTSNPSYASTDARARIAPTLTPDTKIVEVAIYESDERYNNVGVTLRGAKTPVFLILSSYASVNWVIDNPEGADLRGVAYGAYGPGPTVVVADGTPTYEVSDLRYDTAGAPAVAGRAADVRKEEYGLGTVTVTLP